MKINEITEWSLPSMKSYKPRKRRSFAEKNALLLIFLALCTVAFFKFVVEPIVVPEKASALEQRKMTDLEIYQEYEGQTIELCKKKLGL